MDCGESFWKKKKGKKGGVGVRMYQSGLPGCTGNIHDKTPKYIVH